MPTRGDSGRQKNWFQKSGSFLPLPIYINELFADSLRINNNGVYGYRDQFHCRFWSDFRYFCIRNAFSALFLLVNGKLGAFTPKI